MAEEKKIRVLADRWTYQDFLSFMQASNTGNLEMQYSLVERAIVAWDYDVDLAGPDPMMELGVAESTKVLRTVMEMVNALAEDIDYSHVKVDFSPWKTRTFLEFDRARSEGKWVKVERMLHEVASIEGVSDANPLSMENGMRMFTAVQKAYERLVTGKN